MAPAAVAGRGPWRQRSAGLPLGLGDLAYVPRIPVTIPFEPGDAPQRQAAFREMYRVTKPGGRLLAADFNPSRRAPAGRRLQPVPAAAPAPPRRAADAPGRGHGRPAEELAATAGYRVESTGLLPLLRYVLATRPEHEARP